MSNTEPGFFTWLIFSSPPPIFPVMSWLLFTKKLARLCLTAPSTTIPMAIRF